MLLEAMNVDAFYGDLQALHGVTLHVDAAESVALVGANGAGKTTFLRCIAGLAEQKSGAIYFDGNLCQTAGVTCTAAPALTTTGGCSATTIPSVCSTGSYTQVTLTTTAQTVGTSHIIRVETSDGGTFTFTIIAGRSG